MQYRFFSGRLFFWLIPLLIFTSCSVVKTPYFKTDYYKQTISRLDSLKPQIKSVNDTLYAGFARISITPDLNKKYDRKKEAKQNIIPLAGYGNRRGKPTEGVHDSIFVKAVALRSGNKTVAILLQAGLPEATQIAHKHAYATESDGLIHTMGDSGIIYTPGGNYILSIFLHDPIQMVFDPANRMIAELSEAVYNYFNIPQQ